MEIYSCSNHNLCKILHFPTIEYFSGYVGGGKVESDGSFLKWKYAVVKNISCVPSILVCHRLFFRDL